MKKTIKAALKGITTATAGFLKKRGIYVVALALISAGGAFGRAYGKAAERGRPRAD